MNRIQHFIREGVRRMIHAEFAVPVSMFIGFTLLVVLPLFFERGIIFMLDYAPLPTTPFPEQVLRNDFLWNVALWLLNIVFPVGFIQKCLLAVILFTAGFGMYVFLKRTVGLKNSIGPYFGGILYIFNPFVYSRLIVGQWIIVAAYALLPFVVASLVRLVHSGARSAPVWKESIVLAVFLSAIFIVNLHIGIMALLPLIALGLVGLIYTGKESGYRPMVRLFAAYAGSAVAFIILNAYWVIPTFFGTGDIGFFAQHVVSNVDIFSFFTRSDANHGVVWNTAGMYGFWADEDNRYVAQKLLVPYWFYLLFLLLVLVATGIVAAIVRPRRMFGESHDQALWPRRYSVSLAVTSSIAFLFALGVAYPPITSMMVWIYEHVPYFRGFREPHKFVALLVFGYAVFGSIGVTVIERFVHEKKHRLVRYGRMLIPALLLLIPLSYSPGLLWGLNRQLPVGEYPQSWYTVDQYLSSDSDDFQVLVLPWHQYIHLSFAKNVVVNPAEGFFQKPTLAGDNVEFGSIYSQSSRPESRVIEGLLRQGKNMQTMGSVLAGINVKYVVWLIESDFFTYDYIKKQRDLVPVYEQDGIKVYRNTAWDKDQ